MQTINEFSGSIVAPVKQKGFDFTLVSDGAIYKAIQGDDYTTHKGFLTAMSRYANSNGYSVSRYVHPDGSAVEFSLTAKSVVDSPLDAGESITDDSDAETSEEF